MGKALLLKLLLAVIRHALEAHLAETDATTTAKTAAVKRIEGFVAGELEPFFVD